MNGVQLRTLSRQAPLLAALVETGSITAAADELGIPQSSATRSLQRLSEALGMAIYRRAGRSVELTPAGEALGRAASDAAAALRLGIIAAHNEADIAHAQLSIAFQTQLGERFLPGVVGRYHAQRPGVVFQLVHGSRASCIDAVVTGDAEIALIADPPSLPRHLSTPLYVEPLVAVVASGHPLGSERSVTPARLRDFPLIQLGFGYGLHDAVNALLTEDGVSPTVAFEVDDYRVARGLAAAGLGVTVLPRGAGPVDDGAIEVPIDAPAAVRHVGALTSETLSAAAIEFMRALEASAPVHR